MSDIETKNARITDCFLGFEDHGIFTFLLRLDYGGGGQGFGNYALDEWSEKDGKRVGSAVGCSLIMELFTTLGVTHWGALRNLPVRVRASHSKVYAIAPFIGGDWLDIEEFFSNQKQTSGEVE